MWFFLLEKPQVHLGMTSSHDVVAVPECTPMYARIASMPDSLTLKAPQPACGNPPTDGTIQAQGVSRRTKLSTRAQVVWLKRVGLG
jgi:hypothetical protein